jgi:very-short-patch-repair endonuclease
LSNRYEIEFGQLLQKIYKDITIFIPQYNCNKYKIDFYNPEYKLAIEYDEEQHNYQYEQDRIREEKIYNKLHCNFIRITKGQELEGINKINKYVLNI